MARGMGPRLGAATLLVGIVVVVVVVCYNYLFLGSSTTTGTIHTKASSSSSYCQPLELLHHNEEEWEKIVTNDLYRDSRYQEAQLENNTTIVGHPLDPAHCPNGPTFSIHYCYQPHTKRSLLWTYNVNGELKEHGGDEFYIQAMSSTGENQTLAVATIQDRRDGSYELMFGPTLRGETTTTAMSSKEQLGSRLQVTLVYTCGMGNLHPPAKQHWKKNNGGALNAPFGLDHAQLWLSSTLVERPSFLLEHSFSHYHKVIVVGDSVLGQWAGQLKSDGTGQVERYYRSNLVFAGNIKRPLNSATLDDWLDWIEEQHGSLLYNNPNNNRIALVVGSSAWDLLQGYPKTLVSSFAQEDYWKDHLGACQRLIQTLWETYDDVDLMWKLPTALHRSVVVSNDPPPDRVRYMSHGRVQELHALQSKMLLEHFGPSIIQGIDLYPVTYVSADECLENDGRHYSSSFNQQILSWFYDDEDNYP